MPAQKRKASQSDYKPYKKAKQSHSADQYVSPSFKKTSTYRKMVNRGFLGAAGEAKYLDIAHGSMSLSTTGFIKHLDIVPTGTTVNSRDGRKFKNTSVQIRGIASSDNTTVTCNGAMYVVWDRQPNKALTAIDQIFDTINSNSFSKRENVQRFKIIKKWRWAFAGNAATAGQQTSASVFDVDDYVKLPDECLAECTSADTTGEIGNRITGALLLVGMGNAPGGTNDALVNINTRINFQDV